MKKINIIIGVLFFGFSCFSYSQVISTNKLECGEKGKWEVDLGHIQQFKKGKKDRWDTYDSTLKDFHLHVIAKSKLVCSNFGCLDKKNFTCKPIITNISQGDLKTTVNADSFWVNTHKIVKFTWECTDCKRMYPETKLITSPKSEIAECVDSDGNDFARIYPFEEPGLFRLWLAVTGTENQISLTATNADNGEIALQETFDNLDECHLHYLAYLTDHPPGAYDFEIQINGEIIKSCTVQSQ